MVHIPNLTKELYTAGSRHTAPLPKLIKSHVDGQNFDFEWKAKGSQGKSYEVWARGCIKNKSWKGMSLYCECPDYGEQYFNTEETGWRILYVCKHLKAALDSVCDNQPAKGRERKAQKTQKEKVVAVKRKDEESLTNSEAAAGAKTRREEKGQEEDPHKRHYKRR